jgi:sporulation protein YlmC with PRC-barrel domain
MLRSSTDLIGYTLKAIEGNIGKVKDFLFDDEKWGIRYLVADTGGWLGSRKGLLSPQQLSPPETGFYAKHISVALTRAEVEDGPLLEDHEPVSRRYEKEFALFHGHDPYRVGGDGEIWGESNSPGQDPIPLKREVGKHLENVAEIDKCHLRSIDEIIDYQIWSSDGKPVGYLADIIINTENWKIQYFVVKTRKWLPGRKVIIGVEWIEEMDSFISRVAVNLTKQKIMKSPKYNSEAPVNSDYEKILCDYYGRPYNE